jgi:outer membrane protein OmpA-like peptidoglycan-associated protein
MRILPLLLLPLAATACSKPEEQTLSGPIARASSPVALAPASAPQPAATPVTVEKLPATMPKRRGSSEMRLIVDLPSDVLFAYDSDKLAPTADAALARTVRIIEQGGPGEIGITGYSDGKGTDAYNLALSERRAEAVASWLADHGIDAGRIKTQGRGKADPVAPNAKLDGSDDPVGRARNRRVEIAIPRAG